MENRELKILRILAKSWNNLDVIFITDFLTDDFIYDSQWVLTPLKGGANFLNYLYHKFNAIKLAMINQVMTVSAEIGICVELSNRPCIVLTQMSNDIIQKVTVLIETKNDKISRIEICFIPNPSDILLTGEAPK